MVLTGKGMSELAVHSLPADYEEPAFAVQI
jgi:hypothetical protein